MKKAAIFLILTGVFIPVVTFPYVTGFQSDSLQSVSKMKLILSSSLHQDQLPINADAPESVVVGRIISERIKPVEDSEITIPYKHIIAFSALLIFIGIVLLLYLPTNPKKGAKNA